MLRPVIAFLAAVLFGTVQAQPAAPTIEELLRLPDYSSPAVSRNGLSLAIRIPVNGRLNLAVIELETLTRRTLTDYSDRDVFDIDWVGNERIVYRTTAAAQDVDATADRSSSLLVVSRDGKQRVTLFDPQAQASSGDSRIARSLSFRRTLPGTDDEILANGNLRDPLSYDIYRVNLVNGQRTRLTENRPEGTYRYLLDRERIARVAVAALKGTTTRVIYFRANEKAPWQEMARYDRTQPGTIEPLAFTANNRLLRVATNIGRDNMAVYQYDPVARKLLEPVFAHPQLDMGADAAGDRDTAGEVSVDGATDEVLGHLLRADKPQRVLATEDDRRFYRMLDRMLPDTYNRDSRLRGNLYLVSARSNVWPESWHLLDEGKGTLEDLIASRPWLLPDRLPPVRPFTLKTRDGLEIPSYYVLPKGRKLGDKLPTVVLIQSTTNSRPTWGVYSATLAEAHLLAAQGYAVVLPGARGTPGLGNRIYYAGFGALGRAMLNDHVDAARWAIEAGVADSARICISGAEWGGYAALMSVARFPTTFKCATARAPVTDLQQLLTSPQSAIAAHPTRVAFALALAGATSPDAIPAELSPVNLAASIKQPVFLVADAGNSRVPSEQTTRLAEALTKAGAPPRAVFQLPVPPAGAARQQQMIDSYAAQLKFLDEQIGARAAR